ncbi:MAG: GNAT family N-acetyltransferase [Prevotella sp.]|nr:GNAT family N-acetyltransferase [Prevotella sp.]
MSPESQTWGFAKDVLTSLINYAFTISGVDEVYGITDSKNTASV